MAITIDARAVKGRFKSYPRIVWRRRVTTERTVIARKVQGNRRYREAQSKLVVHTTIMNRFRGAYVPRNGTEKSKPK